MAAILGWLFTDGALGFWRYESTGEELPFLVAATFIPAFCALLALLVAGVMNFVTYWF